MLGCLSSIKNQHSEINTRQSTWRNWGANAAARWCWADGDATPLGLGDFLFGVFPRYADPGLSGGPASRCIAPSTPPPRNPGSDRGAVLKEPQVLPAALNGVGNRVLTTGSKAQVTTLHGDVRPNAAGRGSRHQPGDPRRVVRWRSKARHGRRAPRNPGRRHPRPSLRHKRPLCACLCRLSGKPAQAEHARSAKTSAPRFFHRRARFL